MGFTFHRPCTAAAIALLVLMLTVTIIILSLTGPADASTQPEADRAGRGPGSFTNESWESYEFYQHLTRSEIIVDPTTGDLYSFGGTTGGTTDDGDGFQDDLMIYNHSIGGWTLVKDGGGPAPRGQVKLAIDGEGRKLYLYGGSIDTLYLHYKDLWEFDLEENKWTLLVNDTGHGASDIGYFEGSLYGYSMTYFQNPSKLMEYNLTTGDLVYHRTMNAMDHGGSHFGSAFDHERGRFYVMGGNEYVGGVGFVCHDEAYSFDIEERNWTQLADFPMAGRYSHDMAYNSADDCVYLYGGSTQNIDSWNHAKDDLWMYDPSTDRWSMLAAGCDPGKQQWQRLDIDPNSGTLYMYCMRNDAFRGENEIWECRISTRIWSLHDEGDEPGPLMYNNLFVTEDEIFVYSGRDTRYWHLWQPMVRYDLATGEWERLEHSTGPGVRYDHATAYDQEGGRFFVYGGYKGYNTDLWSYNVSQDAWELLAPDKAGPTLIRPVMTYSPTSESIYLFGGNSTVTRQLSSELWRFDLWSTSWSRVDATGPDPRWNATIVHRPSTDSLYLLGGYDGNQTLNDLWRFDIASTTWSLTLSSSGPIPSREQHAVVYNAYEDLMLVFGGRDSNEVPYGDIWIYYFGTKEWVEEAPSDGPGVREFGPGICMTPDGMDLYHYGGHMRDRLLWRLPLNTTTITLGPNVDRVVAKEDQPFSLEFWTLGNPATGWTMETNASWLSWVDVGSSIKGMPTNEHVGTFWVRVNVTNGLGDYSEVELEVVVENTPPAITTEAVDEAVEGEEYLVNYGSTDDGQGNITWYLSSASETWLSMDPNTGVLSGTPDDPDIGEVNVIISVEDGNGGWGRQTFHLNVVNVNDPPLIVTDPVREATEDKWYSIQFDAHDPDPTNDVLSWRMQTSASFLKFNANDRTLEGTPGDEGVGSWWVNVSVSDGLGGSDHVNFTLTVQNVNDPPEIRRVGVHQMPIFVPLTMIEGEEMWIEVEAVDADGDDITYEVVSVWEGLEVLPNGTLHLTAAVGAVGQYSATLTISDGIGGTDEVTLGIIVEDVNFSPTILDPPTGQLAGTEDEAFELQLSAKDLDGDDLTWSDNTDLFKIGPSSGTISFTPGQAHLGTYEVTVTVSDNNGGEAEVTFTLVISNVNDVPVITELLPANGTKVKAGRMVVLSVTTEDEDGDEVTVTWWDGAVQLGTGSPLEVKLKPGEHIITVTVTDGTDQVDYTFTVIVKKEEETPGFGAMVTIMVILTVLMITAMGKGRRRT